MEVAAIPRLQETGSGNRFSSHLPFPSSWRPPKGVAPALREMSEKGAGAMKKAE